MQVVQNPVRRVRRQQQHSVDDFLSRWCEDFSTRQELMTLPLLKTTMRGVNIYNVLKEFFVLKKVPMEKLVAATTDGLLL